MIGKVEELIQANPVLLPQAKQDNQSAAKEGGKDEEEKKQ